jgi:flagellar basal body-associated protein FliL
MLKKGLMIGGGAAAALAAAALVYIFVLGGSSAQAGPAPEPTPVHVEGKLGPHIVLEERVFNLASTPTSKHFLKLGTTVEFETTDPAWYQLHGEPMAHALEVFDHEIGSGRLIIEDLITTIVSGKRLEDLATAEGKDHLRKEIKEAIAHEIKEPHVYRVLFTSFVTD